MTVGELITALMRVPLGAKVYFDPDGNDLMELAKVRIYSKDEGPNEFVVLET